MIDGSIKSTRAGEGQSGPDASFGTRRSFLRATLAAAALVSFPLLAAQRGGELPPWPPLLIFLVGFALGIIVAIPFMMLIRTINRKGGADESIEPDSARDEQVVEQLKSRSRQESEEARASSRLKDE